MTDSTPLPADPDPGPAYPTAAPAPDAAPAHQANAAPPASPPDADLTLAPEVACDLLSEHGGNIVITDDGRIVFMNASAHLVELAFALDPENADVRARMEKIAARPADGETQV